MPIMAEQIKVLPPNIKDLPQLENINPLQPLKDLIQKDKAATLPLKGYILSVPPGSVFPVMMKTSVSSSDNNFGEIFICKLIEPVTLNGNIIIPIDSDVVGVIDSIEKPGRFNKHAKLDVKFTHFMLPDGSKVPIKAKIMTTDHTGVLRGGNIKSQLIKNLSSTSITATTGLLGGLLVGAVSNSIATGAAVGSGIGAIAGLGWIFSRKGKNIILKRDTMFNIVLEEPITAGK